LYFPLMLPRSRLPYSSVRSSVQYIASCQFFAHWFAIAIHRCPGHDSRLFPQGVCGCQMNMCKGLDTYKNLLLSRLVLSKHFWRFLLDV